jgi:hypothetical protein
MSKGTISRVVYKNHSVTVWEKDETYGFAIDVPEFTAFPDHLFRPFKKKSPKLDYIGNTQMLANEILRAICNVESDLFMEIDYKGCTCCPIHRQRWWEMEKWETAKI